MPLLEVENLHVRMGQQEILRGVSLAVPENAIVTVLGSNGVGKTTLMRAVSGIYRSSSGAIRFQGRDIANQPSHAIVAQGLCQAPEGRQIFSSMTVEENLRMGGVNLPASEVKPEMAAIFDLFPVLSDRLKQKAGSLSGGEQQMLCIGRALMGRPTLLLLDEPSLGLAPLLVRKIFELIQRIRERGAAILLVEQNARAALAVADHAYVMEGGKIALQGPAKDLANDELIRAAYLGGKAK